MGICSPESLSRDTALTLLQFMGNQGWETDPGGPEIGGVIPTGIFHRPGSGKRCVMLLKSSPSGLEQLIHSAGWNSFSSPAIWWCFLDILSLNCC